MTKESKAVKVFNKAACDAACEPCRSIDTSTVDSLVPSYKKDKVILALAEKVRSMRDNLQSVRDHRDRLIREKEDNSKVTRALPIILDAIRINNI